MQLRCATLSLCTRQPKVVITPSTSLRSLTPKGRPPSQPGVSGSGSFSVFARARARSKVRITMALTALSVSAMRASAASISSSGETFFFLKRSTVSTALRRQSDVSAIRTIPRFSLARA